jgi:tetratricopeptide (TPR) repeat protein
MKPLVIAGVVLAAASIAAAGQDPFSTARDMYASAAYEDALSALQRLHDAGTPSLAAQVEQYRAFCLYALGRTAEAETVAEALMRSQPLLDLDDRDASPRVRAMFDSVRKRVLPDAIRDAYRAAKTARDANRLPEAEAQLRVARKALDYARAGNIWNESLDDMSVLVDGFLDLIRSTPPPAPAPAPALAPAPAPAVRAPDTASAPAKPEYVARIYDRSNTDVRPPAVIRENIPSPSPQLLQIMRSLGQKSGMVDVLIDESGEVERVTVKHSLNPAYDSVIANAARHWKYQPAVKGGVPVAYLKTVTVTLDR